MKSTIGYPAGGCQVNTMVRTGYCENFHRQKKQCYNTRQAIRPMERPLSWVGKGATAVGVGIYPFSIGATFTLRY